ncbi:Transcriptional regulator, AbiEi antitoxin, Type IV TA system [Desulfonatronum thiosulfatophilum]|uniref:Transcriptional regulator, AbiEi antitoxin, Type IV TA system n=1 Tax=Desulfonatronum thiosulfatophilum TaxID=617002 RepID=A0A1G6EDP1_9BACT|nr:hypothetical protein [Desulfonatronum thiosulfatophilum]SDB55065.1 Transcriptional regulator, AbiEi antitoxin, Type IV TA system [Desulfonatronum thiosulfatophilum]
MQNALVDLPDSLWLQHHFAHHANPREKTVRLVRQGVLHRLKRGLYVRARSADDIVTRCRAANRIYGPSYVSFVYALAWYGLIPEHAAHITSATLSKGRKKRYDTPAGSFFYQDVPAAAYPHGVTLMGDAPDRFLMACPEKALCDELYRASGVRSIKGIEALLFEDLRLDLDEFRQLDRKILRDLSAYYHTSTLKVFGKFLQRRRHA